MLIPANALHIANNANQTALIEELKLPVCSSSLPSNCPLYHQAGTFLQSKEFPFLLAFLERVKYSQDISAKNIYVIKNDNSAIDDEIVYRAFVKEKGYLQRLFNSETWEEWTENMTPLGRVVHNFLEFAQEGKKGLVVRSRPLFEKADKAAQGVLIDLRRPFIEKIELISFCSSRIDNAKLNECDNPNLDPLVSNALPSNFEPKNVRIKIMSDCCSINVALDNDSTNKIALVGEHDTHLHCASRDIHMLAHLIFYRYGAEPDEYRNCYIRN